MADSSSKYLIARLSINSFTGNANFFEHSIQMHEILFHHRQIHTLVTFLTAYLNQCLWWFGIIARQSTCSCLYCWLTLCLSLLSYLFALYHLYKTRIARENRQLFNAVQHNKAADSNLRNKMPNSITWKHAVVILCFFL